jgi:hypothetical protein
VFICFELLLQRIKGKERRRRHCKQCVCAEIRLSQLCLTGWLAKKEVCSIRKNKSRRNRNPFNYNSHTQHVEKRLGWSLSAAAVCYYLTGTSRKNFRPSALKNLYQAHT